MLLDVMLLDLMFLDVMLLDVMLLDVISLDAMLLDLMLLDVMLLDVMLPTSGSPFSRERESRPSVRSRWTRRATVATALPAPSTASREHKCGGRVCLGAWGARMRVHLVSHISVFVRGNSVLDRQSTELSIFRPVCVLPSLARARARARCSHLFFRTRKADAKLPTQNKTSSSRTARRAC